MLLKQSTARNRMLFMGPSLTDPAVDISQDGGSFAAPAGTLTAVGSDGWYKLALTSGDTGTLGDLAYHFSASAGTPAADPEPDQVVLALPGEKVDLVDAPNATAVAAIQSGLALAASLSDGTVTLDSAYDPAKTAAQAGDAMDFVDHPSPTAIGDIQAGLAVSATALSNATWTDALATLIGTALPNVAPGAQGGLLLLGDNTGPMKITSTTGYPALWLVNSGGGAAAFQCSGIYGVALEANQDGGAALFINGNSRTGSSGIQVSPGAQGSINVTGSVVMDITGNLTGDIGGSVVGNLGGRVLGNGSTTIAGPGVWALDDGGNAIPTAADNRAEMDANSTKLDVAVSTRLASADYTTPPTVADIRTEIDANSTKLDVAVSTRQSGSAAVTLPTIPTDWISATGIAASALNGKGDWNTTTPPTVADIRAEIDANSTQLAAIVADTGTDIPASIAALHNFDPANDVVAHVTLVDTTTDLTNGGGGGGGGSGNGARIISVTVNDGNGTNLENATVRFTEGANTFTATTDADGYAEFGLDDATYRLSITKAGYSFTPAQVVVSQSADLTRSMTAIVITPAASNQTNAYGYTKSGGGDIQAGVVVSFKMQKTPTTSTSSIFNGSEFTATSDANGLVQVALQQSSVYAYRRGSGAWKTLITTTASTTALGDIIGHDD